MQPCRPGRQGEPVDVGRLQVSCGCCRGWRKCRKLRKVGGSLQGGRADLQTQEVQRCGSADQGGRGRWLMSAGCR